MKVALAARRAGRLAEVARAVHAAGGEARVVPTDVADEAAVRALVEETAAAWGRLDVVVANAGIGLLAPVAETTAAEFEQIMRVNFLGVVYAVLAALPHLRRQGSGHLVTVASVIGMLGGTRASRNRSVRAGVRLTRQAKPPLIAPTLTTPGRSR